MSAAVVRYSVRAASHTRNVTLDGPFLEKGADLHALARQALAEAHRVPLSELTIESMVIDGRTVPPKKPVQPAGGSGTQGESDKPAASGDGSATNPVTT